MEVRRPRRKLVTLGHLNLALHPKDILKLRGAFADDARALVWLERYRWGDFANDMFREAFGFNDVTSIDFSGYKGASVIQDIGAPLLPELAGQFDLTVNGGTLEHVFNFRSQSAT